nr:FCS-Like Zinc finger 15 [Ipomoea batatas]
MVGLSVVLEGHKDNASSQVVSKASNMIIKPPSPTSSSPTPVSPFSRRRSPPAAFLHSCYLCKRKLLPGKDIYMYKVLKLNDQIRCHFKGKGEIYQLPDNINNVNTSWLE